MLIFSDVWKTVLNPLSSVHRKTKTKQNETAFIPSNCFNKNVIFVIFVLRNTRKKLKC